MRIETSFATLVLCLVPVVTFAQDKPSSLFDSTEFSEKATGIENDQPIIEKSGLLTSAYRKGEATKIGLNFMPKEFQSIVYFSSAKLEQIESEPALARYASRLIHLNQIVGLDLRKCKSMVRGWLDSSVTTSTVGTMPTLLVVKNKTAFDTSGLTAKQIKIGNLTMYRAEDATTFGFPIPDTLVIGTSNEVLNALRIGSGKGNDRQAGLEWIEYEVYDTIHLTRAKSQRGNYAHFIKDKAYGSLELHRNSGVAKHEKERREIFYEFLMSPNPVEFLNSRESEMISKGALGIVLTPENRASLIKTAVDHKKYNKYVATFEHFGPVLRVTEKRGETYPVGFMRHDEFLLPPVQKSRSPRSQLQLERIANFEKYVFDDHRDGTDTEESIARNFESGFADRYQSAFADRATEASRQIEWALNNTSSRVLRNSIIRNLSLRETRQALMILGMEAHRFDLSTANELPDPEEDDRPKLMGNPSLKRNRKFSFEKLEETLSYYANNPGDPVLLTAVCKIAGDLKLAKLRTSISALSQLDLATDRLKEAANAALASMNDSTKTPRNFLQSPADADTALAWIKGTERAKKAAGLLWVMRNPELGERHSAFVSAIIYLLDDGLYYREAMQVLKTICKPEDAPQFQQVLRLAANPRDTNFKMRQEYSVLRVAEMAFHLNDEIGIKLAYQINDYDLGTFIDKYAKTYGASAAQLNSAAIDQFIKEFISNSNPNPNLMIQAARFKLKEDQAASLRKWARDKFTSQDEALKSSRFWDVVENCGPYSQEDIPLIVEMFFANSGFNSKAHDFLSKQGSSIEPQILAELDKGRKPWSNSSLLNLLRVVGTSKSVPYLRDSSAKMNGTDKRIQREKQQTEDAIEAILKRG